MSKLINNSPTVVGLISAAVFCAMMIIFRSMGPFVLVPVLLGTLPVYIAALGWGTRAGIVSVLAISAISTAADNPASGILVAMMIAAPAALAGHQANLAQVDENQNNGLEWYPISQILFWITLLIIGSVILFGYMIKFDPVEIGTQLNIHLKSLLPAPNNETGLTAEERDRALIMNLQMMPFVLPSLWVGIHFVNFLLALKITRYLKVLARPVENIASTINLPPFALVLLVVAVSGILITSAPFSYGFTVAAGALAMAFSIIGLAMFHHKVRDWPNRSPLLVITYIIIAVLFLPVYLFSLAGILKVAGLDKTQGNPDIN